METLINAIKKTEIPKNINVLENKIYSDVVDVEGYQYVDLILEGPGNSPISLCGYTYVLEQCGIRFFNIAGSSAGALNAMMLAALQECSSTKTEKLTSLLFNTDFTDWQNNDPYIKWLIDKLSSNSKLRNLFLLFSTSELLRLLKHKYGLSSTEHLENWLTSELIRLGIHTVSDLEARRERLSEDLRLRSGEQYPFEKAKLSIFTADISNKSMANFPKMASMYWLDAEFVNPAKFISAAMATPFLFYPYEIKNQIKRNKGIPIYDDYSLLLDDNYNTNSSAEKFQESVKFSDAGLFCNFPINHFHRRDGLLPRKPSFGVRTNLITNSSTSISDFSDYCIKMAETYREINDLEFIRRNHEYDQLICKINFPKNISCFEFDLNENQKIELFLSGARAAVKFLEKFNWNVYKDTRTLSLARINPLASMNGVDVFKIYNIPN
jgi:NTE family protein